MEIPSGIPTFLISAFSLVFTGVSIDEVFTAPSIKLIISDFLILFLNFFLKTSWLIDA